MSILEALAAVFLVAGTLCFIAGTIGLLRFPDIFTRLHALTKADNLGLGLMAIGALMLAGALDVAIKILMIWLLVMVSSAVTGHLIARHALRGRGQADKG
ncbi:monovalent cation/H(+) antiporter subunit G [Erythrobacter sp.]|uniref:monovalent cation/H(+) antiporter subunit G n=1 Tax=Erythrobacter sp. TaxID=1042 RepID=UPI001B0B72DF|nr:monovalent cation/H(+) antiporter subunit G [Erythrobacter sp.]MBO6528291.1 monovalent cation/H(+) antiporter subunit G [Erythrobacter sp.]MBO6531363.1 monovalent cation/H(+) antiporter subunit G [Erythrobacter sp.]